MAERSMLFSGEMVCALLAGRKTQTRRLLKPQPTNGEDFVGLYAPGLTAVFSSGGMADSTVRLPHLPGDRLWVRECFTVTQHDMPVYRADARDARGNRWSSIEPGDPAGEVKWRSPVFMPKWASRITLHVTNVRVQRVQEISESDAWAEGMDQRVDATCREDFADLWNRLHARRGMGWDVNPWVMAISFKTERKNISEARDG